MLAKMVKRDLRDIKVRMVKMVKRDLRDEKVVKGREVYKVHLYVIV